MVHTIQIARLILLIFSDCTCSMMFCGAANVGKSSFARYAINRMLEKYVFDKILKLNCRHGY